MRVIILGEELERSYNLKFDSRWLIVASAVLAALLLSLFVLSYMVFERGARIDLAKQHLSVAQANMLADQQNLQEFYSYSEGIFQEQAKQAGLLQARIARLEALGSRLADRADFADEFDFYSIPAVGGPDDLMSAETMGQADIQKTLNELNIYLDKREQELKAIDGLLASKRLQRSSYLAGKPAQSGWLSSHYGKRIDPFTGRIAWHRGIDYAGKEGTAVTAVASGVVVWAGERYGYGDLVEINHGNGYATRYAHNGSIAVKLGDVVDKGQTIAAMGSTGRSTGPHVHFEVLKNGQAINPQNYIYRKSL